eukprot:scaffold330_cov109-Isochrysis_galbana.AAC.2
MEAAILRIATLFVVARRPICWSTRRDDSSPARATSVWRRGSKRVGGAWAVSAAGSWRRGKRHGTDRGLASGQPTRAQRTEARWRPMRILLT